MDVLKQAKVVVLNWTALDQPSDLSSVSLSLQTQADISRSHSHGCKFTTMDLRLYQPRIYPPAALDKSASTHSKPAADNILWYWYPRMLGIVSKKIQPNFIRRFTNHADFVYKICQFRNLRMCYLDNNKFNSEELKTAGKIIGRMIGIIVLAG